MSLETAKACLVALKPYLPYLEIFLGWLLLGSLGTKLEKLGATKGWPLLEAIGQRMEAATADLPKLLGGSRLSSATVAELTALIAKKVEAEKLPPPPPTKGPWFPPGVGPGGASAVAAFLIVVTLCLPFTTSCADQPAKSPEAAGATAAHDVKTTHAAAVLVVRLLDDLNTKWLDSLKPPNPKELDVGRQVDGILTLSRSLLNDTATADSMLPQVVEELTKALDLLSSVGQSPPKEALPAIEILKAYATERGAK